MRGHERLDDREHGLGLCLVPLERGDHQREPSWPVSTPMVICGSSRRSLKAGAGQAPVKRSRFIKLSGGTTSINRDLEDKARALAGIKGYADVRVMPTGGVFWC